MVHRLKTVQPYFSDIWNGFKNFELRRNDRNYKIGDTLVLYEYSPVSGYSNREVYKKICYILKDCPKYGLQDGYCILGLQEID